MRFASFEIAGRASFGAVIGDGIVDLAGQSGYPSLRAVLRAGKLGELAMRAAGQPADFQLANVSLLPPVPDAEKFICVGINYADRNEEQPIDGTQGTSYPSIFTRFPGSLVGHDRPIIRPKASPQFDYEGEIVLVIGRGGRHIPREKALDHIAGMTLGNEGSVRDWMRHGRYNITQGKNFDRSGSLGPYLVTTDEVSPKTTLHLTTKVNGEVRQDDTTERLIHPFDYLIAYISTFAELVPGDVIMTGTPTGAGARFDPPKWLKAGDVVEITVPELGVLRNGVEDER